MRVALPLFGTQISPRFDCAPLIMLVDVESGSEKQRQIFPLHCAPPDSRTNWLRVHGVDVLLCGGLRRCEFQDLTDSGMDVVSGLSGEVEEVLSAFREGLLHASKSIVPFYGGRRRHRAGRGCANRDRRPNG